MADERADLGSGCDPAPADGAHDQVGAVLDGIESDLEQVAASLARMG